MDLERLAVVGLALLTVSVLPGGVADHGGDTHIPCGDDEPPNTGCPDLIVDASKMAEYNIRTRTFSADSCSVIEGHTEPGERRLLRFTFNSPNIGDGDLVIGDPDDHPEWFEFDTCHGHQHFKEYADYRLWNPDAYAEWVLLRAENPDATAEEILAENPELRDGFIEQNKMGFCVIDLTFFLPGSGGPQYLSCANNQGITVGWADEYHWSLDGQWMDITNTPPGEYILESEVNAEHFYIETDYSNNAASIPVTVPPAPLNVP